MIHQRPRDELATPEKTSLLKAGDLQLWALETQVLLDSIPCADPVLSAAVIPNTPYICLGCRSGMLQFFQIIGPTGEPAEGVVQANSLELLPYECKLLFRDCL